MEDPLIGTYRSSMKYNCLLERPKLATPARPFCKLPGPEFTYGDPYPQWDGGVQRALSEWLSAPNKTRRPFIVNFRKVNVDAIDAGHGCNLEQRQFREANMYQPKYNLNIYDNIQTTKVPDITFGLATKPHERMEDLVSNHFFREHMDRLRAAETRKREKMAAAKKSKTPRQMDVKREALTHPEVTVDPAPWKMSRWAKIGPCTSCWWSTSSTNVREWPRSKKCTCEEIFSPLLKSEPV